MLITSMADYSLAVELIRKYEGYSEKAYPDPATGEEPYTLGFGTQFYPDGSPVRQGQRCTYEKAVEYLFNEITVIEAQLRKLNLGLNLTRFLSALRPQCIPAASCSLQNQSCATF